MPPSRVLGVYVTIKSGAMFDPRSLAGLLRHHQGVFQNLSHVEDALNARFVGMEEQIHGLILAVASGEPMLLIGPPGCAKSRLVRAFCGVVGLIDEDHPEAKNDDYFEYLLTPFTEPGELFGFYDIAELYKGEQGKGLVRDDQGMLQHSRVVFLDEVFNASSAVLNSLLSIMNEGFFHDRGERTRVRLRNLFAATNSVPETAALRAFYDRFLLRADVTNLAAGERFPQTLHKLVEAGWRETYAHHPKQEALVNLIDQLDHFRQHVRHLTDHQYLVPKNDDPFFRNLAQLVAHAREYELSAMSNRRIIKLTYVMLVHRLYRAVRDGDEDGLAFGEPELHLVRRYGLDHRRDVRAVRHMERLVEPME